MLTNNGTRTGKQFKRWQQLEHLLIDDHVTLLNPNSRFSENTTAVNLETLDISVIRENEQTGVISVTVM